MLRLMIAFIAGLIAYMIAMVMTVYDGLLSLVFQPIAGAICTLIGLVVVVVLGTPFYWGPLQRWWWPGGLKVSLVILALSLAAMALSWHPSLRVTVRDIETGRDVQSFHPALAIGGWLGMLFGIVYTPLLSLPFVQRDQRLGRREEIVNG